MVPLEVRLFFHLHANGPGVGSVRKGNDDGPYAQVFGYGHLEAW